jgi:hypothetical protein
VGPRGGADWGELFALFQFGKELGVAPASALAKAEPQPPGVAELSRLVERWVRRVALGGDQRRGVAKLDIGQGRFAGAELIVVAEAGRVSVELHVPEAIEPGLAERLRSRLERRGYEADVVVR